MKKDLTYFPPEIRVDEIHVEAGFALSQTNSKELPGFVENDNNEWK